MRKLIHPTDPRLTKRCEAVDVQDIKNGTYRILIEQMRPYLAPDKGIGIAAPQLGAMVRIIAYEDTEAHMAHVAPERRAQLGRRPVSFNVLFNPVVQIIGEETTWYPEGCLSFPGLVGVVRRSRHIRVQALNARGDEVDFIASDWHARCIQHEADHLDGITHINRALPGSVMQTDAFLARYSGLSSTDYLKAFVQEAV